MLFKKGLIFQSETASLAHRILTTYPSIAKALAIRFPVIILDEAQDTSIEQMAVLDLINNENVESMFLVGDPDQSIYEWRDATPECFIDKINDPNWKTLQLTTNFRSSQLICNATKHFSDSLTHSNPSVAYGDAANFPQKPILLFYEDDIKDRKNALAEKFKDICIENKITLNNSDIAIVTRSRVHSDTNIKNLWKSSEVELLAKASYEWTFGSRQNGYELTEKALFGLLVKNYEDIQISIEEEIEQLMSYSHWSQICIELLISLPVVSLPIGDWIKQLLEYITDFFTKNNIECRQNKNLSDVLKIKTRDNSVKYFKSIPLQNFFETKNVSDCTISSIHGVKGESYDALMLIVESRTGKTITPKFINEGPLDQELMRIVYVAMTRPRKLLVVAMPVIKSRKKQHRFSEENWDYLYLE